MAEHKKEEVKILGGKATIYTNEEMMRTSAKADYIKLEDGTLPVI